MLSIRRIFWLSVILCAQIQVSGQQHAPCGSNPVMFSNTCADACLVCDLNGVVGNTTNTIPGQSPPGYCTMVVHSMQWLAFIPGTPNLTFNVAVSSCTQANGVEMGVYASDDCQTFKLVSNCNTNMYANQTWSFTNTEPLKPGCIYYLVFDGNGPNACTVSFTVVSGSAAAPVPNTTNKVTGKKIVCVGEVADYSILPIPGACSYEWRVEHGSILAQKDNNVTIQWDQPGHGKVCVQGTNACKSGNEVCLDVEIGDASPPTELGPFFVCFGESYRFKNILLTAGTWQFNEKNKFGCDSNIIVYVENMDFLETRLDTFLCFPDSIKIGNTIIDTSGNFRIPLKSKQAPFCDSTILIKVQYAKVQASIHKSSDLSCLDTLVTLRADVSGSNTPTGLSFVWINQKGDTLSVSDSCVVNQAGKYTVWVKYAFDSIHECDQILQTEVLGSVLPPDLYLKDSLKICKGATVNPKDIVFFDRNNTVAAYTYHTGLPCLPSNQILDSTWTFDQDTLIYLKATSAYCEDALAVPIQVLPLEHIFIQQQEICQGNLIDLDTLTYRKDGLFAGGPGFYSCFPVDSICAIDSPVNILRDTVFYIIPKQARCPDTSWLNIKALVVPDASFSVDRMHYCLGDSLTILLNARTVNENIIFRQDFTETSWLDSSKSMHLPVLDTGQHTLCVLKAEKICADTSCSSYQVHSLPVTPIIQCFATDSSILFYWHSEPGMKYQTDTLMAGPISNQTDTSIYFYPLGRGQQVNIRVTAKSDYCGDAIAESFCQSIACPPLSVSIDPVDTLCIDQGTLPFILTGVSNPVRPLAQWIWRGNGIIDSLSGLFDPVLAGPGNHRITAIMNDQGCTYFTGSILVLRHKPFADFTLDSIVCQDSILIIRFAGQRADSSRFDWNFADGLPEFKPGSRDVIVRWSKPGKKSLGLKLSQYRCLHEALKEIEVLEHLKPPQVECEQLDSFILFRWRPVKRVKKYKVQVIDGNTGVFLHDTVYRIQKRDFKDSAVIRLILEDEGPCSEVSGLAVSCKPPDCPPKNLLADTLLKVCSNQFIAIPLRGLLKDAVSHIQWFGTHIQQDTVNTHNLTPGRYELVLTGDQFGCKYRDSITLEVFDPPSWGEFTVNPIPCPPDEPLGSIKLTNVSFMTYPGKFAIDGGPFVYDSTFAGIPEGTHRLEVRNAAGCVRDTMIHLSKPENILVDLGPDLEVLKGSGVNLQAMIFGNEKKIIWASPLLLSCDTCLNPVLIPDRSVKIFISVINNDGCIASDSLIIRVYENKVYAPNVFSPNGDQINDFFTLFGNVKEIKLLEIFDRWGNRIFLKEHFRGNQTEEGWDGHFQGKYCLPGVYVFRAAVSFEKGEDQVLQGDLTLIR